MLWFGWIGFNAGSALSASPLACQAFLNTNAGAATSMIMWLLIDVIKGKRMSAVGACCGAVVGLVVITPACGFVTIGGAMCMCIISAIICNVVAQFFKRFDVDDTLDVFACHGVGGTCGMFFLGCFATHKVNPIAMDGLFYGGGELFWKHIVAIIGIVSYVVIVSYFLYKLVDWIFGLRVDSEVEILGMDKTQHGETMDLMSRMDLVRKKFSSANINGHSVEMGKPTTLSERAGKTRVDPIHE
jgi:Amt family ammonium transporter